MVQRESTRLEAEARFAREFKLVFDPKQPYQQNSSAQLVCMPVFPSPFWPRPQCLDVLGAWQWIILTKTFNRTQECPTSTPNFLLSNPNAGFYGHQCTSLINHVDDFGTSDQSMILKQNVQNGLKVLGPNGSLQVVKDGQIKLPVKMVYPTSSFMEGCDDLLVDSVFVNNIISDCLCADFEENWGSTW